MQSNYIDGINRPINVKAQFGEDLRRIAIEDPSNITWEYLSSRLSLVFGLSLESMRVQYIDDEGDTITISSTEELSDAISVFREQPCIRFTVSNISRNDLSKMVPMNEDYSSHDNANSVSSSDSLSSDDDVDKKRKWKEEKKVWKKQRKRDYKNKWRNMTKDQKCISKEDWKREKLAKKQERKEAWKKKKFERKMRRKRSYDESPRNMNPRDEERFQTDMAILISMGFTQRGFNAMLLKKFASSENRVDKAVEMFAKNAKLQGCGFTKTCLNLRMLIKFDGNLDEVKSCLKSKEEKFRKNQGIRKSLDDLRDRGYSSKGINRMLLIKLDGDIEKVENILAKAHTLEEKGYKKFGLNVRLLLKNDGDIVAAEECLSRNDKYHLKHEKKQFKKEKKMIKHQFKMDKKRSKEFHKRRK